MGKADEILSVVQGLEHQVSGAIDRMNAMADRFDTVLGDLEPFLTLLRDHRDALMKGLELIRDLDDGGKLAAVLQEVHQIPWSEIRQRLQGIDLKAIMDRVQMMMAPPKVDSPAKSYAGVDIRIQ